MKALILIAHGSKKELSNNEFISFVSTLKTKNIDYDYISPSFLELALPSIQEATKEAINKNCKEIYFYPYFLNSGKHVTRDIPRIINELKEEYKDINFTLLEHFGKSNKLIDIVLNDVNF